jgi:hypothetical protein
MSFDTISSARIGNTYSNEGNVLYFNHLDDSEVVLGFLGKRKVERMCLILCAVDENEVRDEMRKSDDFESIQRRLLYFSEVRKPKPQPPRYWKSRHSLVNSSRRTSFPNHAITQASLDLTISFVPA